MVLLFVLAVLGSIGCIIGGLSTGGNILFVILSFFCLGLAMFSLIRIIRNTITQFVNLHRNVRQSIDDERIRKFHEYGKGDGNGL